MCPLKPRNWASCPQPHTAPPAMPLRLGQARADRPLLRTGASSRRPRATPSATPRKLGLGRAR
eukprot:1276070-Alexandrium_andersonii.AAC.1